MNEHKEGCEFKGIDIYVSDSDDGDGAYDETVSITENGIVHRNTFKSNKEYKFNFCPMCGIKLGVSNNE